MKERTSSGKVCEWCQWPLDCVDPDIVHACHPVEMYERGAAVAFGLMGMFETIRENWLHVIPTDYSVLAEEPQCVACGRLGPECLSLLPTEFGSYLCEDCDAH